MIQFEVRNVAGALGHAVSSLLFSGEEEASRNGPVIVAPTPVMTTYHEPCERVLFSPTRNANPFFHLFESLWMLAGRNDVEWIARFNSRMREYSDDGKTFWGAYGRRWTSWFSVDQLKLIADDLRDNPTSRRAVLSMWDGGMDMEKAAAGGKDVPCNTHAYFDRRDGRLNMTVCNRSNDAIWGAYGANAVHFSMLLEYLAARVGCPVGEYRQLSNNLHIYTDVFDRPKLRAIAVESAQDTRYLDGLVTRIPILGAEEFDGDLADFVLYVEGKAMPDGSRSPIAYTPLFRKVVYPMLDLWNLRGDREACEAILKTTEKDNDWITASREWLLRYWERKSL